MVSDKVYPTSSPNQTERDEERGEERRGENAVDCSIVPCFGNKCVVNEGKGSDGQCTIVA